MSDRDPDLAGYPCPVCQMPLLPGGKCLRGCHRKHDDDDD